VSEGRIRVYGRRLSNREIADLLPLSAERQRERDMLVEEQNLLKQCLSAMPVGYIPTHTAENLPEMICDLAKALAEETTERENLECELDAMTGQRDRLAEELRTLIEERNEVCNQRDAAFERYNEAVELYNAAVIGAKLIDKDLKKAKRDLKKAESERDKLEKGLKDLINYANSFKPFFNRYQKRQTADTKGDDHE
jgi:flagellar biosynthesis chaperone FliJ